MAQSRTKEELVTDINRFQCIHDRAMEIVEQFKDTTLDQAATSFAEHFADDSHGQADAAFVLHALSQLSANELCHLAAVVFDAAKGAENVSINSLAVLDLVASNAAGMGSN